MRCRSPRRPQRETEPFVELNASLPSRLSPSKHWRRHWDHNYAVPGKPVSLAKPHQYTLSRRTHAEHVTHSWVSRADKSKAYAFKYMNTWLQLGFLCLFGCCRIEMQVFHCAYLSTRASPDSYQQLIEKMDPISLLKGFWYKHRIGYWLMDRDEGKGRDIISRWDQWPGLAESL